MKKEIINKTSIVFKYRVYIYKHWYLLFLHGNNFVISKLALPTALNTFPGTSALVCIQFICFLSANHKHFKKSDAQECIAEAYVISYITPL